MAGILDSLQADTSLLKYRPRALTPGVTLFEGLEQGVTQQFRVDSMFGLQSTIADIYTEHTKDAGEYGLELPGLSIGTAKLLLKHTSGELDVMDEETDFGFWVDPHDVRELRGIIKNYEALRGHRPELPGLGELVEAGYAELRRIENETAVMGTGGASGNVGLFAGQMLGSFTPNDPLNMATLPVGGFGKAIATRVLTEGAAMATIEAVNQFGFVQPNRARAGLDSGFEQGLEGVLFAGAGGAALRGFFEAAAPAAKAISARARQGLADRAATAEARRLAKETVERVMQQEAAHPGALAEFVASLPGDSAAARALQAEARALRGFWGKNPFRSTAAHRAAMTKVMAEVAEDSKRRAAGLPVARRDVTERFTDADTPPGTRLLTPEEVEARATAEVRQELTDLAAEDTRIRQVANEVKQLERQAEEVESVGLAAIVDDPDVAWLTAELDNAMEAGNFAEARAAADELEQIEAERYPTARADRAAELRETAETAKQDLVNARKRLSARDAEFKAALDAARERLAAETVSTSPTAGTPDAARADPPPPEVPAAPGLGGATVEPTQRAAEVGRQADLFDDRVRAASRQLRATRGDAKVEIGPGAAVEPDFVFHVAEAADAEPTPMSAKELADELDMIDAVRQAVNECMP